MTNNDSQTLEQGEIVACDSCMRARPIELPVQELFGSRIGFGPGGEKDMFVERDGEVKCRHCIESSMNEVPEPGELTND